MADYRIYADAERSGKLEEFMGDDENLETLSSFVISRAHGDEFIAQKVHPDVWEVYKFERVEDGKARVGDRIGRVSRLEGYPRYFRGFERLPGGTTATAQRLGEAETSRVRLNSSLDSRFDLEPSEYRASRAERGLTDAE